MWEAGDKTKVHASDAYLNWDCSTSTLCILVKAREGYYIKDDDDDSNMWFKEYGSSNSPKDPIGEFVQRIFDGDDVNPKMIAWEACFPIDTVPACLKSGVEVHANFFYANDETTEGRTTSTGKENSAGYIALDLTCPCENDSGCQIDACYKLSECVGSSFANIMDGTCQYAVVNDNCCINDDDCAGGYECIKDGETAETGICQLITSPPPPSPTNPSPSDGGGTSTTSPMPSADRDECSVSADCPLSLKASKDCAVAVCNIFGNAPSTCGVVPINASGECTPDVADIDEDECVAAYVCTEVECVATYKARGTICGNPVNSGCVEYKCQPDTAEGAVTGRTICEADIQEGKTCSTEKIRGKFHHGIHENYFHIIFHHI
jgi:hypothetical protein